MDSINLPPTTLSEVATILQNGMRPAFREVNVDISACPCLTRKPFNLTGIGLSGRPSVIHVGDYINIIPTPRPNKSTWNIGKRCEILLSAGHDSFIFGSGYAVKPYMPYNGHVCLINTFYAQKYDNIIFKSHLFTFICQKPDHCCSSLWTRCRAPAFINNRSRIVFADASNGQTRIEMLTRPDQMICSLMGNFFISEGKQGNVLRVRAKGRESIVDIITIIQSILHRHFYEEDRTIALGGVLQMRNGRVAQNVMPEQYPPRVSSFIDLARWFKCHDLQLKSDLIAVGTIINTEPDILYEEQRYDSPLPRRHHQFHSFSTDGVGGQFVNDIMSTVEYKGYFNLANKIYMWNS
ncbi:ester hydrolase C11orf54 homolog [Temnothorax americanus]|uniref:ester hydrolase C11orf54 homolog n=1 Tax=Temnothorax americanus TaxID=1964332 RepID=UPI004068F2A6